MMGTQNFDYVDYLHKGIYEECIAAEKYLYTDMYISASKMRSVGTLMKKLRPDDMLVITADHGCDPGFKGTDHTREYVPCLIYGDKLKKGVDLGTRGTFADQAATIGEFFGLDYRGDGESFLPLITE